MTIEIDHHPIERAEDELRALLLKYNLEDVKMAVSNLNLGSIDDKPYSSDDVLQQPVGQVIKSYILGLPHLEVAETTRKDYRQLVRKFAEYCHCHASLPDRLKTDFSKIITRQFFSSWINWKCPSNRKNSTRNKVVAFTRHFLRNVLRHVPIELMSSLEFRGVDDTLRRSYTTEQVTEMLQLSRQLGNNLRNHTILKLFVGSGIRVDELCLLQIRHVDFKNRTIQVHPKGAKQTLVTRYVNSEAFDVLANYITYTYGDPRFLPPGFDRFVFTGIGRTNRLSTRTVQKMVESLMARCKTMTETERTRLSVHSFRHFFALSQLRNGVDIYTISKLLGHKSVKSTENYLKLFNEELRAAVDSLKLTQISDKHLVLIHGMGES